MKKVFIWTDIGTNPDDILAVLMALRSSEIEVVGMGTCQDDNGVRAVLLQKILQHEGKNIPVGKGFIPGRDLYLKREVLGESRESGTDQDAIDLFLDVLAKTPDLEVLTLGPLTEFCAALSLQPELKENISCWIAMGGSIDGNEEFNFCSDPQATRQLLETRIPKKIVPLELGRQFFFDEREIDHLNICREVKESLQQGWEAWKRASGRDTFYLCDPVAVASLIGVNFLSYKEGEIVLEKNQGRWTSSLKPAKSDASQIAVGLDRSSFFELFYGLLG